MFRLMFILSLVLWLSGCVTSATLGISDSEWETYSPEQREKMVAGYYEVIKNSKVYKGESDNTIVNVGISGGKVNIPPYDQAVSFQPVEFEIDSGMCSDITLKSTEGHDRTKLKVCYYNKVLYIDPSRYDVAKGEGSIRLHVSPVWTRGFTFKGVSSTGFAKLNNVNISVKLMSSEAKSNE